MSVKKVHKRFATIARNTAQSLMPMFLGMVLSLLVVRLLSPDLWGRFVSVQIWVFLTVHLAGWGNKEHLLIQFSKKPAGINSLWAQNFVSRIPLVVLGLLLLLLPFSWPLKIFAILWMLAKFSSQSFDAPILYFRRFTLSLITDIFLYLLLFAFLLTLTENINLLHLIAGMAAIELSKTIIFSIVFKNLIRHIRPYFSLKELSISLPFFLLGLSGLLQSKVDLFIVSVLMPPDDISTYHVYLGFLFLILSIPNFIIMPYAKNLYRMDFDSFSKLRKLIMSIALPVVAVALLITWILVTYVYNLTLSPALLILGFLFVLPSYFYSPLIRQMFRLRKQNMVVKINFCGFVIVFLPGLFLVNIYGITGALAAAAANQWVLCAVYYYFNRNIARQPIKAKTNATELITEAQL